MAVEELEEGEVNEEEEPELAEEEPEEWDSSELGYRKKQSSTPYNGTFIRSFNGTILGDIVKVHRVRLSREEIKMIARALRWFSRMIDEKDLMDFSERQKYRDLALRFIDWGEALYFDGHRMFRRTRR